MFQQLKYVKNFMTIMISLLLLMQFNNALAARSEIVFCPANDARAELTNNLPHDWWYTPTVGRLLGVRIQNIAGQRTLVCLYKAFAGEVAIMRKQPYGSRGCKADGRNRRFVCFY